MQWSWAELGVAFTIMGTLLNIGLLIWRGGEVSQQIKTLRESREAHDKLIAAHKAENDGNHDHMMDMIRAAQLEAAQKFVTIDNLAAFKSEVVGSINRLVDRVDRVLDGRGHPMPSK